MIFTDANLDRLGVYYIGNKQNGGALLLSKQEQRLDEESRARLREALLQRFTNCHERYSFMHPNSLEYNEVYNYARKLLANQDQSNFYEQSVNIARHLFESSLHPKIKPGELYIALFNRVLDDETSL
ncbi:MAG TPA: nucleoid-associated protein, partial [Puia sp.]|nr:nucleoid-associated protein [Puia sp.]